MSDMLKYKDYVGSVSFSNEDEILFGKIEYIRDLVSYHGNSVPEIKVAFENAVDEYLQHCAENGKKPDVAYKGQFQVRVKPEIHRSLATLAGEGSLNALVEQIFVKHLLTITLEKCENEIEGQYHHITIPKALLKEFSQQGPGDDLGLGFGSFVKAKPPLKKPRPLKKHMLRAKAAIHHVGDK